MQSYFNGVVPYLHAEYYPTHLGWLLFSSSVLSFMFMSYPKHLQSYFTFTFSLQVLFSCYGRGKGGGAYNFIPLKITSTVLYICIR